MDNNNIEEYILKLSDEEPLLLQQLYRETHLNILYARMLSGHIQGSLLRMISHMLRPERILEIGTFTGYSALCLSEGLSEHGVLHTIEINPELEQIIRKYISKAGKENKIILHIGKAFDIIPGINERFDLVFIDADKESYPAYYEMIFDKVNPGGFILADNVLWDGKVVLSNPPLDKETQGILAFNKMVKQDSRAEKIILPVRDGISIIRKIHD